MVSATLGMGSGRRLIHFVAGGSSKGQPQKRLEIFESKVFVPGKYAVQYNFHLKS